MHTVNCVAMKDTNTTVQNVHDHEEAARLAAVKLVSAEDDFRREVKRMTTDLEDAALKTDAMIPKEEHKRIVAEKVTRSELV